MDESFNRNSPRIHGTNGSARSRKKQKSKAVGLWGDIEGTLGLHGVRRIKPKKRTLFFSILWCLILLTGVAIFAYELVTCLQHYLQYPTSWEVHIVDANDWPALTLCNLNPVRVTKLATNYWKKDDSGKLYKYNFNWETFLDERPYIKSQEFFLMNSHKAEDMIIRCESGSTTCSNSNFTLTLTEDGLCYKIKPDRSADYLKLTINTETYEYTSGLAESSGVKVYVHDLDNVPIRDDRHVYMYPGHHFEMAVGKDVYKYLNAPYGWCDTLSPNTDTRTCLNSCYLNRVRSSCSCIAFWFPSDISDKQECDIKQHFTCVMEAIDLQHRFCHCPMSCKRSTHTVQMTNHPVDLSSLYKIMDDNLIDTTMQRYREAKEVQVAISRSQRQKDEAILRSFLSIYGTAISSLERLERDLFKVKTEAQDEYVDLGPRVHFHTNVALRGIQMTIEKGYSAPWRTIEDIDLQRIERTYQELINRFNAIITRLRFTTAIEFNLAKLIYTLVEMELSVNMDLTAQTLESVTALYYAFVDTKSVVDFEITPDKRYDSDLLPYDILVYNREIQQVHYSVLSNNLGLYIDDILQLKGVLRAALITRQYNETVYLSAKKNFIQHSSEVGDNAKMFREQFITRCEKAIHSKIEFMTSLNHTLFGNIDLFEENVVSMENFLSTVHLDVFRSLKQMERTADLYVYHSNVTRVQLTDTFNSDDVQTLTHQLDSKIFELRMRQRELEYSTSQLQHSVNSVWRALLNEELLRSFYLKISSDVIDMIQNPKQTTYFMNIFTDESMLNMTVTNKTDEVLERFFVWLNADLHSKDLNSELERVNQTFLRISSSLVQIDSLVKLLKQVQSVLLNTQRHLVEINLKEEFTRSFAKQNLLSVTVTRQPGGYQEWSQKPAFTLQALFVQLGSLLAFILGASVLTVLEFCDILLAWIADRFFSEGSKATREIPPEYRDKIKSRESLGSSRASMDLNNSLNSQKRSYVTFRDFNNVNGSEV